MESSDTADLWKQCWLLNLQQQYLGVRAQTLVIIIRTAQTLNTVPTAPSVLCVHGMGGCNQNAHNISPHTLGKVLKL